MSGTLSHRRLPRYVNARKFAYSGVQMTASLAISELDRLSESLADNEGEVVLKLAFTTDYQYNCRITGNAKSELSLICQRCLAPFVLPIECQLKLMMVGTEQQAENLPASWEPCFINGEQINLYQLIEDELLLALPLVARHQNNCVSSDVLSYGGRFDTSKMQSHGFNGKVQLHNPFKALKDLKNRIR